MQYSAATGTNFQLNNTMHRMESSRSMPGDYGSSDGASKASWRLIRNSYIFSLGFTSPAWVHISICLACALGIAIHTIARPQKMWIMGLVWPITGLYIGPVAVYMYRKPCR